jgi:NADH dehydrogenase
MTKLFVTGSTGFLGSRVVCELQKCGYDVTAWARSKPAAERLQKISGAKVVVGNFSDIDALIAASKGCNAILHLVGAISETGRETFEETHVNTTRAVILAARSNGIRRIVYISALGARPLARSRYHQTKYAAENLIRESGVDYTILRPSFIFGEGNHTLNLFRRLTSFPLNWLQLYTLPCFGTGKNLLQPIHVDDVVLAIRRCLTNPQTIRQTIDLVGAQRVPFSEFLLQVCSDLGKQAQFDRHGLRTILRHLHWFTTILLGIIIAVAWIQGALSVLSLALLICAEVFLIFKIARPHPILIFPFPLWLAIPVFWALECLAKKIRILKLPIGLDALTMLEEDNIGDMRMLEAVLGISPTPFIRAQKPAESKKEYALHKTLRKIFA